MSQNLELWNKVSKTDPAYTKKANVKGNKITAIDPQYQIMNATEQFGPYGKSWGLRDITWNFELSKINGLALVNAVFFYPEGSFSIANSIGIYRDNAQKQPDDQFAKKAETDMLTKALSKLGFNADIFLGMFDDVRYVEERKQEVLANEPITSSGLNALNAKYNELNKGVEWNEEQIKKILNHFTINKITDLKEIQVPTVLSWLDTWATVPKVDESSIIAALNQSVSIEELKAKGGRISEDQKTDAVRAAFNKKQQELSNV